MGRGLGGGDALDGAVPEAFRRFRHLLFGGVGDEGGDGRAGAGNAGAQAAHQRAAQDGHGGALQVILGRHHVLNLDVRIGEVQRRGVVHRAQELRDAEQAERQGHQFEAVREIDDAEGETLHARVHIRTHDAEHQAQHGHGHALEGRALGQRRARQQAQQHQRADLRRAELEGHLRHIGREEDHLQDAEGGAEHGAEHGDAERHAAATLFGHGETIQTGHRMGRMTGQVEQNGADGAAILRAIINA